MNWQNRRSASQVMERQPLTSGQIDIYCRMKAENEPDRKIFQTLFPPEQHAPAKPRLGKKRTKDLFVSKMKKPELVDLLKKEFGRDLASLQRMKKTDLRDMYYILRRLKED